MTPEPESARAARRQLQPGRAAERRVEPIRGDDQARLDGSRVGVQPAAGQAAHSRVPDLRARFARPPLQGLAERGAPDAQPAAGAEPALHARAVLLLAARLVGHAGRPLEDQCGEPGAGGVHGGGEPRGTPAADRDVPDHREKRRRASAAAESAASRAIRSSEIL